MFSKINRRLYMQAGVLVLLFALLFQLSWQIRGQATSAGTDTLGMRPSGVTGGLVSPSGNSAIDTPPVDAGNGILVGHSTKNDVSPALRDIKPVPAKPWTIVREMPEPKGEDASKQAPAAPVNDPVVQKSFGPGMLMPGTTQNFDGLTNLDGVYPPDTNGDVGPNHYVQWVNLHFQVFSKTGVSLYGPAAGNTLWTGFGGPCETQNAGDPIALYDQAADRWVMSQFTSSAPYGECIAVSTTGDPTGTYNRYFFQHSTTVFYDYPHMSVWSDGYYTGFNRFAGNYQGPSAIVYDRTKMLAGQPATYQEKQLGTSAGTLIPSDVDGATAPPAGSPAFFMARASTSLQLYKFHVDWVTPANSTLTGPTSLPVDAYNQLCSGTRSCIPQPSTTVKLDGIGDRIMYRVAYRNFGTYESIVTNHSVNVANGQAGVRWYEVRNPNGVATIYQQGTYSPDTTTNRWMGSIAQDAQGNMALGYSVASASIYPSIRYTGRLAGDPLGQMPQGEATLIAGTGAQTGTGSRWGDYSAMQVDPVDDCTFWYTTEYLQTTGGAPWKTRIGSFKFPGCVAGPQPTPTNTPIPPTPTDTPVPLPTNTPTLVPPTATPNPNPADFTIGVSPPSQTVTQGQSTTYTVTISAVNGFNGSVNLSVSGLPNKARASFSPNPVPNGSGTSTLTITTHRQGGTGTYPLTITGTSGSLSHSTNATLIVNP